MSKKLFSILNFLFAVLFLVYIILGLISNLNVFLEGEYSILLFLPYFVFFIFLIFCFFGLLYRWRWTYFFIGSWLSLSFIYLLVFFLFTALDGLNWLYFFQIISVGLLAGLAFFLGTKRKKIIDDIPKPPKAKFSSNKIIASLCLLAFLSIFSLQAVEVLAVSIPSAPLPSAPMPSAGPIPSAPIPKLPPIPSAPIPKLPPVEYAPIPKLPPIPEAPIPKIPPIQSPCIPTAEQEALEEPLLSPADLLSLGALGKILAKGAGLFSKKMADYLIDKFAKKSADDIVYLYHYFPDPTGNVMKSILDNGIRGYSGPLWNSGKTFASLISPDEISKVVLHSYSKNMDSYVKIAVKKSDVGVSPQLFFGEKGERYVKLNSNLYNVGADGKNYLSKNVIVDGGKLDVFKSSINNFWNNLTDFPTTQYGVLAQIAIPTAFKAYSDYQAKDTCNFGPPVWTPPLPVAPPIVNPPNIINPPLPVPTPIVNPPLPISPPIVNPPRR